MAINNAFKYVNC